jgi:hypothetical protein
MDEDREQQQKPQVILQLGQGEGCLSAIGLGGGEARAAGCVRWWCRWLLAQARARCTGSPPAGELGIKLVY